MKRKRNYSRFYAIAKAKSIDLDQHKEVLVSQFTGGRTSSLREMTPAEYEEMCECLQTGKRLGVDTADRTFAAVDEFCLDPRIAGKPFGMLTVDELQALVPKLEAILRKPKPVKPQRVVQIPIFIRSNQLPS